jgi:DNA-binding LacI/PurR family transcriptional regulator
MNKHRRNSANQGARVTLKTVGDYVGLAAGTVSQVLNNTPHSKLIPQHTKDRVFAAARKLNYQPNLFARALRTSQPVASPRAFATGSRVLVFEGSKQFLAAVSAIRRAGLRVPGDVSVVGVEEISATHLPSGA